MSTALSTIVRPAGQKISGAYFRLLTALWESIARYLVHRAAIAHLRELDDRALQDIGLTRSQIEAAVRGFIPAPRRVRI